MALKYGLSPTERHRRALALDLVTGGEVLDLVMLDLNLPSMHGRAVLRRLRVAQATQRLPVIILTRFV